MSNSPEERRSNNPILDAINSVQQSLDVRHSENTGHLAALEKKVDKVLAGFPDGDPLSHRKFHEALIDKAKAREKFWNDLRAKLIERGIWSTLVLVIGLMLAGAAVAIKNWRE